MYHYNNQQNDIYFSCIFIGTIFLYDFLF